MITTMMAPMFFKGIGYILYKNATVIGPIHACSKPHQSCNGSRACLKCNRSWVLARLDSNHKTVRLVY